MTEAKEAGLTILKTLAYFDIFNYPLSEKELRNFLGCSINDVLFDDTMRQLTSNEIVFTVNGFYALDPHVEKVNKRLEGNDRASKLLPVAARIGSFLFKFPYVRGVAVSGSLSKNYSDKKGDIDFFIVTGKNRLWIARTLLHLFKKSMFLVGRQRYYCMNYFIDEDALVIPDQNIYTATEVVTLLPVAGSVAIQNFFQANNWTDYWYPSYVREKGIESDKSSHLKKFVERFFDSKVGDKLDEFLFRWTTRRWKRKEQLERKNSKGRVMNLLTGKHFSKSDPEAFQERIVTSFKSKMQKLSDQWTQCLAD